MSTEYNKHHILYCRKTWDKGYAKKLRDHWYLHALVPAKGLHEKIHKCLNSVPIPPHHCLVEAYKKIMELEREGGLYRRENTLVARINLLLMLWAKYPEAKATCAALKVQKAIAEDYYRTHPCR